MARTRKKFAGIWIGLIAFGLVACHSCERKATFSPPHAKLSFPCDDAGATKATDPNNCGACGTICGTYGRNTTGSISFIQGTCSYGACSPYIVAATSLVSLGYPDCWNMGIGWVFRLQGQNATCVNLLSDNQNCGGVGWTCSNFCQDGICNGFLTMVQPLTLVITVSHPDIPNYILSCTGGIPPCYFSFGVQGNNTGGTIGGAGHNVYTPGATPGTDGLRTIDSRGVEAVATYTVSPP